MYAAQAGVCRVCSSVGAKGLAVDHCHTTGKVRGLLCGRCNTAIGLMKDDVDLMRSLALYVEETRVTL